jgi:hypothetical protein
MNAPSSESEEFGAVVVAGGGDRASGLDTSLSFSRVHADQVQGKVFERGQVVCRVACARIWSSLKANIQAPVQAIFRRPVGANRSSDPFRIGV